MAAFLGGPKVQFFDSNGDPLSGGKLHTYDPGTTDNKAAYPTIADAIAGTNALANPVVLDSRGEATVVLAGNTKLVLKDSADTTIYTVDNVDLDAATKLDANGNEIVDYDSVASAVNYLQFKNSATGNDVEILAAGDDTNIGITITPKGVGTVNIGAVTITTPFVVQASASSASEIRLEEDTDNGDNYISLKAPASIASNVTFTLPSADGSSGEAITTDGFGTFSFTALPTAASQADLETGTSTTTYTSPGRQQYHPSASKGWAKTDTDGTVLASYNVTSVADGAVGQITITWATDLSSTEYAVVALSQTTGLRVTNIDSTSPPTAGTTRISAYADGGALADPAGFHVAIFGDQ